MHWNKLLLTGLTFFALLTNFSSGEMSFAHLLPPGYRAEISRWVHEDCPTTDIGGFVVGEAVTSAELLCKTSGVLAGVPFAQAVFDHLELEVTWLFDEGAFIDIETVANKKVLVARVTGKCRNILLAERTALNILSRAAGVATQARKAVDIAKAAGWKGYTAGTRKTTPGFKMVEKYALLVGGAATHRMDLSQMVMLKDNHIWASGNIPLTVAKARLAAGFSMKIEVQLFLHSLSFRLLWSDYDITVVIFDV